MEIRSKYCQKIGVALGTWFLNLEDIKKKGISINRMEFVIGDLYTSDAVKGCNRFYLTKDKSLLYKSSASGDYSILLGGNWRYELIVDSTTGLCVKFQSFLDELKVSHRNLFLPKSKPRRVFFIGDEVLFSGEGCHYYPFFDKSYWDKRKCILCIGNPNIVGEAVEFTPQATMVVRNGQIVCLYLELKDTVHRLGDCILFD